MFAVDLEVFNRLAVEGKGLWWGVGEAQGLLGSSACFSRTVVKVVLCLGAHGIEEQGNDKTVATVVTVKLRGRGADSGPWHFCKRNQNFFRGL